MSNISLDLQKRIDELHWKIRPEIYDERQYTLANERGHYMRQFITERELEAYIDGYSYARVSLEGKEG